MVIRAIAILFLGLAIVAVDGDLPKTADPISERLQARIKEKLVPAYRADNQATVQNLLGSIINELGANRVQELDDLLSDEFLPSAGAIFAALHLDVGSGKANLKRATPREAVLVLAHARESIDEVLDQREWVAMLNPGRKLESSFEEYERAIWDAHVYRNQLENAIKRAALTGRFQRKFLTSIKKKQPDFTVTNYASLAKKLYRARVELHERDLRLKLDRIAFATQTLQELEQLSKEDTDKVDIDTVEAARKKIWSVYVLQKDGETLLQALKEYEKPGREFQFLDDLNKSKSRSAARKKINAGRKLVGKDLLERSEHLFDGLHWWFRGRYGRGTHNLGLLKLPAAAHNIKAQNALKMPKQPPRPTDPAMFARRPAKEMAPTVSPSSADTPHEKEDYVYGVAYDKRYTRSPDYDRRHHYIWSQKPPMFVTQSVNMFFH